MIARFLPPTVAFLLLLSESLTLWPARSGWERFKRSHFAELRRKGPTKRLSCGHLGDWAPVTFFSSGRFANREQSPHLRTRLERWCLRLWPSKRLSNWSAQRGRPWSRLDQVSMFFMDRLLCGKFRKVTRGCCQHEGSETAPTQTIK